MSSFTSHIENSNPFFIPFLLFLMATTIHYIHRILNKPGRLRRLCTSIPLTPYTTHYILCGITIFAISMTLLFEIYFHVGQCQVSNKYMEENENLFRQITSHLTTAGIIWWVDMATLLSVLRKQRIVAWDHDTDISLIHPASYSTWKTLQTSSTGEVMTPAFTITEIVELLKKQGINAYYVPERDLLQVRWSSDRFGPHTDVWFWRIDAPSPVTPSTAYLTTSETSIYHNHRPYTSIFPLSQASFLNISVTIPADPHQISNAEYAHYGGDYMKPQWFRKDCLHNWWQARWRY